ncbi:MAG: hypothetical protein LUD02_05650 [Tannerellaceae bacterium]|nr:hypothetical protein [Tannerellaceae bacterium]MCD8263693.1 hypothetical protein [Tannerellaceae bacterium]
MNRLTTILTFLCIVLFNLLQSCDGLDENYSTNPNHRLSFSTDTLAFDTVFTTIGSATRQFMVYNTNNEALLIESVMLAGSGSSGFRINVDGRKGDYFNDVRIKAEDSLYVFVEVTVDPNGIDQPLLVEDSVVFMINGIQQTVLLEAYGQDVNLYKGGKIIISDTILEATKPYLIYDSLVIAEDVHVWIEPGATFYMHDKANILVYGTMEATGTLEQPITFRGDRLDFIQNDILPYDRVPGQWGGIFFQQESFNNKMDYVLVRNGKTGLTCEESTPDEIKLSLTNSQINNMSENLFVAINCHIEAVNTEFSNARRGLVMLMGGRYNFIHCTLANYMTLASRDPNVWQPSLMITNDMNNHPVEEAIFINCIIDGNTNATTGELELIENKDAEFNYLFDHCAIKTPTQTTPGYADIIFLNDETDMEYTLINQERHIYDFRPLSPDAPYVGKAKREISAQYPEDRYGIERLTDWGPTIGAYEYVPIEDRLKE